MTNKFSGNIQRMNKSEIVKRRMARRGIKELK